MTSAGHRVAVVGARGRVGSQVCARLTADGIKVVGLNRGDGFASFPDRVESVINCATLDPPDRQALGECAAAAGAPMVEVCGLDPARETVETFRQARLPLLVGAGMMPGISELMPGWLTPPEATSVRITGYVITRETLTAGAAHEIRQSRSRANVWSGSVQPAPARRLWGIPGAQGPMLGVAYLTPVLARYAAQTSAEELAWYFCHEISSPLLMSGATSTDELIAAVASDVGGRQLGQLIACEVSGLVAGSPFVTSGLIGGVSTYDLTAGAACWFAGESASRLSAVDSPWAAAQVAPDDLAAVARWCGATVTHRWAGPLSETVEGAL